MKVALVLPGSIWYAPYVRIYTRILNEENVDYVTISWCSHFSIDGRAAV